MKNKSKKLEFKKEAISRLEMNTVKGGINHTTANSEMPACRPSIEVGCAGHTY